MPGPPVSKQINNMSKIEQLSVDERHVLVQELLYAMCMHCQILPRERRERERERESET